MLARAQLPAVSLKGGWRVAGVHTSLQEGKPSDLTHFRSALSSELNDELLTAPHCRFLPLECIVVVVWP